MSCPYCGSSFTDYVDKDNYSTKWICQDCKQDFIVWNDGEVTTRNNILIEQLKKGEE